MAIPNAAFGVRRTPAGLVVTAGAAPATRAPGALEVPAPVFFESFGIENHPVEPDVRYETTLEDLTGGGKGWLRQIDAVLSGRPLAVAAARPPRVG